jgi:hypothetical protein
VIPALKIAAAASVAGAVGGLAGNPAGEGTALFFARRDVCSVLVS